MFKNYLRIAIRNLLRHRLFSGLNIFGLATGMACSLLIFLWVEDELGFDRFHEHADRIYRVTAKVSAVDAAVVPPPLAAVLKTSIPGVVNATRLSPIQYMVTAGNRKFDEKHIYFADSNFFKIFSFPSLAGDAAHALLSPDAVVITSATAIKYFGNAEQAIGKTIYIDNDIKGSNFVVGAVLHDLPFNSHLQFDMLLPMQLYDKMRNPGEVWNNFDDYVYFQLSDQLVASPAILQRIATQLTEVRSKMDHSGTQAVLSVQPLTAIHLHSHFMLDVDGQGNSTYVTIFSLIAVFILIIACINFMNLATALSAQRAREVGLRKTIGAQRIQLIFQFLGESMLIALLSLGLAILIAIALLPMFNTLSSKSLSLNLFHLPMVLLMICTAVVVGLVSGSYPAFYLSSFSPVKVLKGIKAMNNRKSLLRNGLVVFQFSISVVLMISTLVVYRQLEFIKNRDIGFNKENLLYVPMPEVGDLKNNKDAWQAKLQNLGIKDYTITDALPTNLSTGTVLTWPGMDPGQQVICFRLRTDPDFMKTFGMHLVAGRFFSRDSKVDDSVYVVNETTVKLLKLNPTTALGKTININDRPGAIIGVLKDFNFKPVQHPVEPLVMRSNFSGGYLVVRTSPEHLQPIIGELKKIFSSVYPDYPFSFGFIDADLSKMYLAEQQMGKLFNVFSLLSIIISCLGLFGLATFATQRRIKEIGIRKVMGASGFGIVITLSTDFIRLVAFSLAVAFPVAWLIMNQWLQGFSFRISLSWWIFAIAGAAAFVIAFLTISFQSIKAALANPVNSLRTN